VIKLIKAIIVDDERPAVDKLCRLLDESNVVDVKGAFTDPLEALAYIKNKPIDAVFLDIEMPGLQRICGGSI
jgi:two-component SAPR family response regulator